MEDSFAMQLRGHPKSEGSYPFSTLALPHVVHQAHCSTIHPQIYVGEDNTHANLPARKTSSDYGFSMDKVSADGVPTKKIVSAEGKAGV